tara:strand:- start:18099 stop:18458 length:360 start_codon:yes stop_codon:yes gene_type:complete
MNAHSIKEYILSLEKDNFELREQLEFFNAHVTTDDDESDGSSDDDESVGSSDDVNVRLSKMFYEKSSEEENINKKRAYEKVGEIIGKLQFEVTSGEEIQGIKGIGPKAVRLINQWLSEH